MAGSIIKFAGDSSVINLMATVVIVAMLVALLVLFLIIVLLVLKVWRTKKYVNINILYSLVQICHEIFFFFRTKEASVELPTRDIFDWTDIYETMKEGDETFGGVMSPSTTNSENKVEGLTLSQSPAYTSTSAVRGEKDMEDEDTVYATVY